MQKPKQLIEKQKNNLEIKKYKMEKEKMYYEKI